ncbi:MAG: TonB-dependent receptor, partial [Pseudomonadota bacterium]
MTKNWFLSCTALTLSLAAAPAVSWAQSVEPVDVPAQTLADALAELGRETGLQISVRTGLVEGKTSTAVQGDLTPQSALEILLSGTGLTYSAIGEDGVVIAQAAPELETDETGALVLDEIIVQGERVARSLFETSSSVSVVTGERIEQQRTVRDARQAVRLLPNVFDEDGTNNSATIRGLDSTGPSTGAGAFIGGARPRGSVVVDGRSLSSLELSFSEVSVWDVEQIEAFNGPQTTTNGTNSLAGATFIKTRDPSFEVEGALRVYAGNFATNGIAAMVNLPIVEDQIAFRGTFDVEHQNVWRNAVLAPPNDKLDNNERINIRAKMLFEPEILPDLSSLFTFNYSEDSGPQTLLSDAPFRLRESNAPLEASFNNNY